MSNGKQGPASIFVVIIIGLIGIFNISRTGRFATFHTVDILQLLVSGMCFGVALSLIFASARRR